MVTIRFAKKEDEERIVDFIRENWTGNQTLVRSRPIFHYQYMTFTECGFVLAEEDGKILGIKGYVPMNRTDSPDIAVALAIVMKNSHPMLNMEIQRYLEKNTNCRMMCSTGLNANTAARIYPLFHYTVDKLKHFYMLSDCNEYRIAIVKERRDCRASGKANLRLFKTVEEMLVCFSPEDYKDNLPYKDEAYLRYRFFEHPFYRYYVYGISMVSDGRVQALLIGRESTAKGTKVFRIVDYVGAREAMAEVGTALRSLMNEQGYEYVDFYCYGMPEAYMVAAGFTLRDADDPNVIPNYFEPFVQKNVDVVFFCKQKKGFLICKADGDQDRPNIIN